MPDVICQQRWMKCDAASIVSSGMCHPTVGVESAGLQQCGIESAGLQQCQVSLFTIPMGLRHQGRPIM